MRKVVDHEERRCRQKHPKFLGVAACVALIRRRNVQGTWDDLLCGELAAHAA